MIVYLLVGGQKLTVLFFAVVLVAIFFLLTFFIVFFRECLFRSLFGRIFFGLKSLLLIVIFASRRRECFRWGLIFLWGR